MKHSVIQLRREFVPSIGMSKDNGFFATTLGHAINGHERMRENFFSYRKL